MSYVEVFNHFIAAIVGRAGNFVNQLPASTPAALPARILLYSGREYMIIGYEEEFMNGTIRTVRDCGTAVITGASSGIGAAFARRLAGEGFKLVLAARRKGPLAALAHELESACGIRATVIAADLSTDRGIARLEATIARDRSIAMLVNCAGFGTRGHFAAVDPATIEKMTRLHVMATVLLTRAALPRMIGNGRGAVINVSSLGSFFTTSHYVMYSATKAFINMFTLGLRAELAGTGVKAQALCPGLTRTGFMHTEEYRDFSYDAVPGFAWMEPDEVVDASLAALARDTALVIPGLGNRMFVAALRAPLIGPFLFRLLGRLGRGAY